MSIKILDCTLRDGGYYNNWDFPVDITNKYLEAMQAAGVQIVELGLRSLINKGFKGPNAFTTDSYLETLNIPKGLDVSVMINGSELVGGQPLNIVLEKMFPKKAIDSRVQVVRIACHVHEFAASLPASKWLKDRGYSVGFNLMQIADRSQEEIENLAKEASLYPVDALYFADSMGSMTPDQTSKIIAMLKKHWKGNLGIHTHDNMGLALQNTLQAIKDGVTWLDATVTGMGRGPGNARTEELVIETSQISNSQTNIVPLMTIIRTFFQPLKNKCGWGTNPYYYLAGKFGIHPTYIQEMLGDSRYSEEDILAAINHLKIEGGKKFSFNTLDASRHFFQGEPKGVWSPETLLSGKDVLILGAGKGVSNHKKAIESYILNHRPVVIALNTQSSVSQELIDLRVACHPVRLLADCDTHSNLPQPLITPASMLPEDVRSSLKGKKLLDYGLSIKPNTFGFDKTCAVLPNSLVMSYVLAIVSSGKASRVYLAGFDGYGSDDPRTVEMQRVFDLYKQHASIPVTSLTPTGYLIDTSSIYAMAGR